MAEGANWSATVSIPRFTETQLTYFVSFVDWSGNWNVTIEREVAFLNPPPIIAPIPDWHVVEGVEATLDIRDYVSDGNDPVSSLAAFCDHRDVSIDGMVLTATFDVFSAHDDDDANYGVIEMSIDVNAVELMIAEGDLPTVVVNGTLSA